MTTLPPTHRLVRSVLAGAAGLVLLTSAIVFASSALPGQLWSGCMSFLASVRRLW